PSEIECKFGAAFGSGRQHQALGIETRLLPCGTNILTYARKKGEHGCFGPDLHTGSKPVSNLHDLSNATTGFQSARIDFDLGGLRSPALMTGENDVERSLSIFRKLTCCQHQILVQSDEW